MTKTVSEMTVVEKFMFYEDWQKCLWTMYVDGEISAEEYESESIQATDAAHAEGVYLV